MEVYEEMSYNALGNEERSDNKREGEPMVKQNQLSKKSFRADKRLLWLYKAELKAPTRIRMSQG